MDLLRKLRTTLSRAQVTEDEIAFYEAVLKKSGSTVFEISKYAGFSKDRGYKLFENLKEKGLVTTKQYCGRRGVFPASLKGFSEKLFSASRKFWRVAENLENLDTALPLLREIGVPTNIEAFTIDEFPEHWLDLAYTSFDFVCAYGNFGFIIDQTGVDCDRQFINHRVKRGGKADLALQEDKYTKEMISKDNLELRKTRILNIPELENKLAVIFPSLGTVSIWQKNSSGAISGLKIKNPMIANFHRDLYEYFKNQAVSSQ